MSATVKERPILFSAPMVNALIENRKTQTRRIYKPKAYASTSDTPHAHECPYGKPGDRLWVRETWRMNEPPDGAIYKANLHPVEFDRYAPWKPSIFMPRNLSRITLEITDVRVERVQSIGEDDAKAEGVLPIFEDSHGIVGAQPAYRYGFANLWNSINGNWNENPFVWVIEFRKVDG